MTPPATQASDTDLASNGSPSSNELTTPNSRDYNNDSWFFDEDLSYAPDLSGPNDFFDLAQFPPDVYTDRIHYGSELSREATEALTHNQSKQGQVHGARHGTATPGSGSVDDQDEQWQELIATRENTPAVESTGGVISHIRHPNTLSAATQSARRILQNDLRQPDSTESTMPNPRPAVPIDRAERRQSTTRNTKVDRLRYFCSFEDCNTSFGREADRDRHKRTVHRLGDELYLCDDLGCGHLNYRKDKMTEHCQKQHRGRLGFTILDAKSCAAAKCIERRSKQLADEKCASCGSKTKHRSRGVSREYYRDN